MQARLRDTSGFALALAIFALVLLAAVVAGGYFSASQEFQIGRGMRSLTTSVYAGEVGIYEVLDNWDPEIMVGLAPGDTMVFGPVNLEGGGSYLARAVRVGRAADSVKRYFYIEAVGQTPLPHLGARRQAMVVRARFPNFCCGYAMRLYDELSLQGSTKNFRVDGRDQVPGAWMSLDVCDAFMPHDTAAISARDVASVAALDAYLVGSPKYTNDYPSVSEGVIFFPGYTWSDLVNLADHTIGSVSSTGAATVDAYGECDEDNPLNWGAPTSPGHACFEYFPIIHVTGNITFESGARAQGIFLVDEDVTIENNAQIYGIILARNDLIMSNQGYFWGMGWIADDAEFQGTKPEWHLSSCAVRRALLLSSLGRPTPVSPRAWVELF